MKNDGAAMVRTASVMMTDALRQLTPDELDQLVVAIKTNNVGAAGQLCKTGLTRPLTRTGSTN